MAATLDLALSVHPEMGNGNYLGGERKGHCIGEDQSVKCQFYPSLAKEPSRVTVILKVPSEVSASRKDGVAKDA